MKYCGHCRARVKFVIPEGDNRKRYSCPKCSSIFYSNPKIVTGTLPVDENQKVLLCKRGIEPRYGLWTLPAGFLEDQETIAEGALRETQEETHVSVELQKMYTLFNLPDINQVYIFYLAKLTKMDSRPTPESLEVQLFSEDQIPWGQLAFRVVSNTLKNYFADCAQPESDFPMRIEDLRFPNPKDPKNT